MNDFKLLILLTIFAFFALTLETTVINFPFVFILAAILTVFIKKIPIYILAFILSFTIDSLRVTNFGITPIFLVGVIFSIMFYEKYSGSKDILISTFIIGVITYIYSYFLSYSLQMLVIFSILITCIWLINNRLNKKTKFI